MLDPLRQARERLERLLGLAPAQARRAISETLDCLRQGVDEYIAARHRELQELGIHNPVIFEKIAQELAVLRFAAPTLSARQIRRRIYG
ncbi:MAG: hypothetical protein JW940_29185 [Polyangiaceae bacterium]|nr:hypothetical protein [Polyangiaceae bacterium]